MRSGMHEASHLPGRPADVDDAPAPEVNQNQNLMMMMMMMTDRQTEGQTEKNS